MFSECPGDGGFKPCKPAVCIQGDAGGYISADMGRIHRVTDEGEGIRRVRAGRGFSYRTFDGRTDHGVVRDPVILERIRALAIPPAWTDVWICPSPDGHVQATGRDAKGRKQYRYHANWRAARERQKFDTLAGFGGRAARDPATSSTATSPRGDLSLETVTAGVVLLLERTMIRVGNEEYVHANGSFGLTTLRSHHARVSGDHVDLRFIGKGGIPHDVTVDDAHIAELVQRCRGLDGDHLFQYLNGDRRAARDPVHRRQRLPAPCRERRRHREGLPHMDGHVDGRHRARRRCPRPRARPRLVAR